MPYTRETRIKHYRKDGKEYYSAQIKWNFPFTNIGRWEDFDSFWYSLSMPVTSKPAKAFLRACDRDKEATGLTFAKLVIDTYFEMLDNPAAKDGVIEYIKYP